MFLCRMGGIPFGHVILDQDGVIVSPYWVVLRTIKRFRSSSGTQIE